MFDRDDDRRRRKAKRRRDRHIKEHKRKHGTKPAKSERKLSRWDDEREAA